MVPVTEVTGVANVSSTIVAQGVLVDLGAKSPLIPDVTLELYLPGAEQRTDAGRGPPHRTALAGTGRAPAGAVRVALARGVVVLGPGLRFHRSRRPSNPDCASRMCGRTSSRCHEDLASDLARLILGLLCLPGALFAQASIFGVRGPGFPGRPYSAAAIGTAGSTGMFDPQSQLNPASLGPLQTGAASFTLLGDFRSVDTPAGSSRMRDFRFPNVFITAPISRAIRVRGRRHDLPGP